jgi:hypothetical protein
MRARSLNLLTLAIVLPARLAIAAPPDFSGRWSLVVEEPAAGAAAAPVRIPATASSGWGREITITREDGRLTIERHQFVENDAQPPMRFTYALGGAESRNAVNMGRGPQEQVGRASLEGDTLVIASRHHAGSEDAAVVAQVFSVDAAGALVVETKRTAHGVTSTTTARYRRLPPPAANSPASP